jgi:DNA helicase-2/ATP-dependent DNA helicase PcrA
MEEERRLCYVGMTRARQTLYLSGAASRKVYNNIYYHPPSRFIGEIPPELMQVEPYQSFGSSLSAPRRPTPGYAVQDDSKQTKEDEWW